jgi:DNA-binding MarR family transcriptional regulator
MTSFADEDTRPLPDASAGETSSEETDASPPRRGLAGKRWFPGAFADAMFAMRTRAKCRLIDLSSVTTISKGWLSQIENAVSLPNAVDRDRIVLRLAQLQPEDPLDPAGATIVTANDALAAWQKDKQHIDRAVEKGDLNGARFLSRDTRRERGVEQRVRILQILVDELYQRSAPTTVPLIADKMRLNAGSVTQHVRKLLHAGLVTTGTSKTSVTHVTVTRAGYDHAVVCGEASGSWRPAFAQASEVLVYAYRKWFEDAGELMFVPPMAGPVQHPALVRKLSGPEPLFLRHGETVEDYYARKAREERGEIVPAPTPVPEPPASEPIAAPAPLPILPDRRVVLDEDAARVLRWMGQAGRVVREEEIVSGTGLSDGDVYEATGTLIDALLIDTPSAKDPYQMGVTPLGAAWLRAATFS